MSKLRSIFQHLASRESLPYLLLSLSLIPVGLYTRIWYRSVENTCDSGIVCFWGEYVPDALYALMFYFLFRWIWTSKSRWFALALSLGFCYGIEILQLYQAEWINEIRATRIGGLILGFHFLWSDIICYSVGILLGWMGDLLLGRK